MIALPGWLVGGKPRGPVRLRIVSVQITHTCGCRVPHGISPEDPRDPRVIVEALRRMPCYRCLGETL